MKLWQVSIGIALLATQVWAAPVWETDFVNGGTQLSDFIGTGEGQFNSYGTKGSGNPQVLFDDASDAIQLRTTNYTDSSLGYPYAGISQTNFGIGNQNIASFAIVLAPQQLNGAVGNRGMLQVGQVPTAWDSSSSTFGAFNLAFSSTGFFLENRGNTAQDTGTMTYGEQHLIEILCVNNREAAGVSYTDYDGVTQTITPSSMHIYIDGEFQGVFSATTGRESHYFTGFQMNIGGHQASSTESMRGIDLYSLSVDNTLTVAPEPTTMGLLTFGGLLALKRRRK